MKDKEIIDNEKLIENEEIIKVNKEEIEIVGEEKAIDNLFIYNKIKEVPKEAQKEIKGGRLSGMTDIKPMWRIEKLTELFGPCGFGWKAPIKNKEIIEGANGEKIAIVDIDLYIKVNNEWSEAIEGTGGSSFIAKEKNGLYTSDECFKMAYTDAISVACKSLGMGANIYWGDSKYNSNELTKEDAEKYTFESGKHKGWTLKKVVEEDKGFLNWLLANTKDERLLKMIELLTGEVPKSDEEWDKELDLTLELQRLIVEKNLDEEKICDHYKVKKLNELTKEQIKEFLERGNK